MNAHSSTGSGPRRLAFVIVLSLLTLEMLGCGRLFSPAEPEGSGGDTVVLAVGQSAPVSHHASLVFDRVVSDSRCPSDLTCVSAGEATIALTLLSGSRTEAFTLSDQSPSTVVNGLRVRLLSLKPYPKTGTPIPMSDYRATLRATATSI